MRFLASSRALVGLALRSLQREKLSQDIAYSLASFGVLAFSGIIINIVISAERDVAALGVFNIAYAVYILASQLATWGIHYSVLRHSAYFENDQVERAAMLLTATACTVVLGILATACLTLAQPWFASVFKSDATARAIGNAAWGLLLFPLNKVLLAYLNGLRAMKAYALLQALRYIMIMTLVAVIASTSLPTEALTLCFVAAECVTALAVIGVLLHRGLVQLAGLTGYWIGVHFRFGSRGLAAGMFTEINSRVDVLMIGFFLSERATGIYSFAAMLVDGLYHVLAVVRLNFNPLLVAAQRDQDRDALMRLRRQSAKYVLPATLMFAITLLIAYYVLATVVMPTKGLIEGVPSLIVLLVALVAISVLVPFDNLMIVSGHPGHQTAQQLAAVMSNSLIAVIGVPTLGILGAALGTAVSYMVVTGMLIYLASTIVGWNLVTNAFRN